MFDRAAQYVLFVPVIGLLVMIDVERKIGKCVDDFTRQHGYRYVAAFVAVTSRFDFVENCLFG